MFHEATNFLANTLTVSRLWKIFSYYDLMLKIHRINNENNIKCHVSLFLGKLVLKKNEC